MQRIYLVYQAEIFEKPIIKGVFASYSAAKYAAKNLDSLEGLTHVVEPMQVFNDIDAMRKRREKRILAKKLVWLRKQAKKDPNTLPHMVLKQIYKYRDKNLL